MFVTFATENFFRRKTELYWFRISVNSVPGAGSTSPYYKRAEDIAQLESSKVRRRQAIESGAEASECSVGVTTSYDSSACSRVMSIPSFDLGSGTTFDSLLAIYSGDRLDRKVPIAGNDNYGTRRNSRVSFEAFPGTNYSLVVAGKSVFDPTQAAPAPLLTFEARQELRDEPRSTGQPSSCFPSG